MTTLETFGAAVWELFEVMAVVLTVHNLCFLSKPADLGFPRLFFLSEVAHPTDNTLRIRWRLFQTQPTIACRRALGGMFF